MSASRRITVFGSLERVFGTQAMSSMWTQKPHNRHLLRRVRTGTAHGALLSTLRLCRQPTHGNLLHQVRNSTAQAFAGSVSMGRWSGPGADPGRCPRHSVADRAAGRVDGRSPHTSCPASICSGRNYLDRDGCRRTLPNSHTDIDGCPGVHRHSSACSYLHINRCADSYFNSCGDPHANSHAYANCNSNAHTHSIPHPMRSAGVQPFLGHVACQRGPTGLPVVGREK